jgi:predicted HicB family RNase H-like nuclease
MLDMERLATEAKNEELYRVAYNVYSRAPDWATFYREILGLSGLIRRSFPGPAALAEFEKTDTYQQIHQLLKCLRERKQKADQTPEDQEPTRVITVRLPRSLHESLRAEAHLHQTSMNKLCISKLLQFIDEGLVPGESREDGERHALGQG